MIPKQQNKIAKSSDNRLKILVAIIFLFAICLTARLYQLQIVQHKFYLARAENQGLTEKVLLPKRGEIFIRDGATENGDLYPLAVDKQYALIYAIPNEIGDKDLAAKIAEKIYLTFDEPDIRKQVEADLQKKDSTDLSTALQAVSNLSATEKASKEAEIKKYYSSLYTDHGWQLVREEEINKQIEAQKNEAMANYEGILNRSDSVYAPLKKKVEEDTLKQFYSMLASIDGLVIKPEDLSISDGKIYRKIVKDGVEDKEVLSQRGINYVMENYRFYPENNIGAQVLGFTRLDNDGLKGNYGLEGFFDHDLAGQSGSFKSTFGGSGSAILNDQEYTKAIDGNDLILTINRSLEFFVCQKLKEAVTKHRANSGNVIVVDPTTGAILAMCAAPDFDPNNYQKESDMSVFNNPSVFEQYEPGSVFKAITMAAALNEGKISPTTTYNDPGEIIKKGWSRPIKNSDFSTHGPHGITDMIGVLEYSLNTGAMFAMDQIGIKKFAEYVKNFGFGDTTGIELEGESSGNITNLIRKKPLEIDADMASFGQAITVTPLQMVMAYAAIANDGILMKPFIVKEIVHPDGTKDTTTPVQVRQVISEKAANLLVGMLVSVVEEGHAKGAQLTGYFVGGKTGTAQVAENGVYSTKTDHTFIGILPADNPKFVVLAEMDDPKDVTYAEGSVIPLFHDIEDFMVKYYQIPKDR